MRAQGADFSKHIPSLAFGVEKRLGDHIPHLPSSWQVHVTECQALCCVLCVRVCLRTMQDRAMEPQMYGYGDILQ